MSDARKFDHVVIASRFQPVHSGHLKAVAAAAALASELTVLCLGADEPLGVQAPYPTATRLRMLHEVVPATARVLSLRDIRYDDRRWRERIGQVLSPLLHNKARVAVIADPMFAKLWPNEWHPMDDLSLEPPAAQLLKDIFWGNTTPLWSDLALQVPPSVLTMLESHYTTGEGVSVCAEAAYLKAFRRAWEDAPYPPIFVTVDALVTWRDEVLLIERGNPPGKGLWALPGGFVDVGETLAVAARRELEEETGLVLGATEWCRSRVIDDPQRSLRGRTITHVFQATLDTAHKPAVRGGDDATTALWVGIDELQPAQLIEDHYAILQLMLAIE